MSRQVVELHIEQLVLHGIAPIDRTQLAATVEAELTRWLSMSGALESLGPTRTVGRLDGGRLTLGEDGKTAALGAGIVQAMQRGLRP